MKIGIIENDTNTANQAIQSFYRSIIKELDKIVDVIIIQNIESYDKNIDFTLGIGRFSLHINDIPAYDYYKVHHYCWIIDNPLKLNLDIEGKYISYIMIDNEFKDIVGFKSKTLFLPLGTDLLTNNENYKKDKTDDIVFVGQVKDHNKLYKEIASLDNITKKKILIVIDEMIKDLNQSFIQCFNNIVSNITPYAERIMIFKYSNSYIRAYKRFYVLNAIRDFKFRIIGQVDNNLLASKNNITIDPPTPYYKLKFIYQKSKISLNINPNFNYGCHDRIINSIACDSVCLTDSNPYIEQFFKDNEDILTFNYNQIDEINEKLNIINYENKYTELQSNGLRIVEEEFTWKTVLSKVIGHYENR